MFKVIRHLASESLKPLRPNTALEVSKLLFVGNEVLFIKHRRMATVHGVSEKKKYLIVGLGNKDCGKHSRHSVGMKFVDILKSLLQDDKMEKVSWTNNKNCLGHTMTFVLDDGTKFILLKPKPVMNLNGKSVSKTVKFYGIDIENVYLVHDEIGLAVGKSSIKDGGSAGGHNGVRSVIDCLRTDIMKRIRIGIDRPSSREEVADYVLDSFPKEEQPVIHGVICDSIVKMAKHMNCQELVKKVLEQDKENSPQGTS